jgi:hypothetical protein
VKPILTIILLLVLNCSSGQESLNICNCYENPTSCIPAVSKRKIVRSDTTIAHHSYCYEIYSFDEKQRIVVITFSCATKPTDSFYLSFFDSTTLGTKAETWYDTLGRFVFYTVSQNKIIKECYSYHYSPHSKKYDYIIGYRNGELFKEVYKWDKYEAGYDKKIIITRKEITTVIYTDERDVYGYTIQKVTTVPNKTGKIDYNEF